MLYRQTKDKLNPILTMVLYYGKEPWNGPTCLNDMLNWENIPEVVRNKVVNYPIYIVDVRRFRRTEEMCTDAKLVFGFLQRHENQQQLEKYVNDNKKEFTNLEEDTYDMISILTSSQELIEDKQEYLNEKGEVNMCKALEDMKASARLKEREDNIYILAEALRELNVSQEDIVKKIEEKYQLPRQEANKFVKK